MVEEAEGTIGDCLAREVPVRCPAAYGVGALRHVENSLYERSHARDEPLRRNSHHEGHVRDEGVRLVLDGGAGFQLQLGRRAGLRGLNYVENGLHGLTEQGGVGGVERKGRHVSDLAGGLAFVKSSG